MTAMQHPDWLIDLRSPGAAISGTTALLTENAVQLLQSSQPVPLLSNAPAKKINGTVLSLLDGAVLDRDDQPYRHGSDQAAGTDTASDSGPCHPFNTAVDICLMPSSPHLHRNDPLRTLPQVQQHTSQQAACEASHPLLLLSPPCTSPLNNVPTDQQHDEGFQQDPTLPALFMSQTPSAAATVLPAIPLASVSSPQHTCEPEALLNSFTQLNLALTLQPDFAQGNDTAGSAAPVGVLSDGAAVSSASKSDAAAEPAGAQHWPSSSLVLRELADTQGRLAKVEASRDALSRDLGHHKGLVAKLEGSLLSKERQAKAQADEMAGLKARLTTAERAAAAARLAADVTPERCRDSAKALMAEAQRAQEAARVQEALVRKLHLAVSRDKDELTSLTSFATEERRALLAMQASLSQQLAAVQETCKAQAHELAAAQQLLQEREAQLQHARREAWEANNAIIELRAEAQQLRDSADNMSSTASAAQAQVAETAAALSSARAELGEVRDAGIRLFKQIRAVAHALERNAHHFQRVPDVALSIRQLQDYCAKHSPMWAPAQALAHGGGPHPGITAPGTSSATAAGGGAPQHGSGHGAAGPSAGQGSSGNGAVEGAGRDASAASSVEQLVGTGHTTLSFSVGLPKPTPHRAVGGGPGGGTQHYAGMDGTGGVGDDITLSLSHIMSLGRLQPGA